MFYNDFDNPEKNSIIDLEKYKEICKVCDEILLSPEANEVTVAIPILHVIREHPVFLKQYQNLFTSTKIKKSNLIYTDSIKKITKFLISSLLKSFNFKNFWHSTNNLKKKYDYIFVSHLLNEKQAGNNEDFYFGEIPTLLNNQGKTVLIVLINHTAVSNELLYNKWNKNDITRVLLSPQIGLFNEIQGCLKIFKEFSRLNSLKQNNILGKKIISLATSQFLQTLNNYRLSKQFMWLAKKTRPNNIVTTFEGHAWERIVFSSVKKIVPNIKCIGYQHALIFKEQHSIKRILQKKYNPDLILTSGYLGKKQLDIWNKALNIDIKVLGTNRLPKNSNNENCNTNKFKETTILVIPEAIFSECILLFEYSISCALMYPNLKFIWRLHPLLKFDQIFNKNEGLAIRPNNIILSKQTLEADIYVSNYVLYRGSTAVINCVLSGLKPIYLQINNEMTIDPLYEIDSYKFIVTKPDDLILTQLNKESKNEEAEKYNLLNHCNKLMVPFDFKILL
jgi:hypothetical protein